MAYIIVRFTLAFLLVALAMFAGYVFLGLMKRYLRIDRELKQEEKQNEKNIPSDSISGAK